MLFKGWGIDEEMPMIVRLLKCRYGKLLSIVIITAFVAQPAFAGITTKGTAVKRARSTIIKANSKPSFREPDGIIRSDCDLKGLYLSLLSDLEQKLRQEGADSGYGLPYVTCASELKAVHESVDDDTSAFMADLSNQCTLLDTCTGANSYLLQSEPRVSERRSCMSLYDDYMHNQEMVARLNAFTHDIQVALKEKLSSVSLGYGSCNVVRDSFIAREVTVRSIQQRLQDRQAICTEENLLSREWHYRNSCRYSCDNRIWRDHVDTRVREMCAPERQCRKEWNKIVCTYDWYYIPGEESSNTVVLDNGQAGLIREAEEPASDEKKMEVPPEVRAKQCKELLERAKARLMMQISSEPNPADVIGAWTYSGLTDGTKKVVRGALRALNQAIHVLDEQDPRYDFNLIRESRMYARYRSVLGSDVQLVPADMASAIVRAVVRKSYLNRYAQIPVERSEAKVEQYRAHINDEVFSVIVSDLVLGFIPNDALTLLTGVQDECPRSMVVDGVCSSVSFDGNETTGLKGFVESVRLGRAKEWWKAAYIRWINKKGVSVGRGPFDAGGQLRRKYDLIAERVYRSFHVGAGDGATARGDAQEGFYHVERFSDVIILSPINHMSAEAISYFNDHMEDWKRFPELWEKLRMILCGEVDRQRPTLDSETEFVSDGSHRADSRFRVVASHILDLIIANAYAEESETFLSQQQIDMIKQNAGTAAINLRLLRESGAFGSADAKTFVDSAIGVFEGMADGIYDYDLENTDIKDLDAALGINRSGEITIDPEALNDEDVMTGVAAHELGHSYLDGEDHQFDFNIQAVKEGLCNLLDFIYQLVSTGSMSNRTNADALVSALRNPNSSIYDLLAWSMTDYYRTSAVDFESAREAALQGFPQVKPDTVYDDPATDDQKKYNEQLEHQVEPPDYTDPDDVEPSDGGKKPVKLSDGRVAFADDDATEWTPRCVISFDEQLLEGEIDRDDSQERMDREMNPEEMPEGLDDPHRRPDAGAKDPFGGADPHDRRAPDEDKGDNRDDGRGGKREHHSSYVPNTGNSGGGGGDGAPGSTSPSGSVHHDNNGDTDKDDDANGDNSNGSSGGDSLDTASATVETIYPDGTTHIDVIPPSDDGDDDDDPDGSGHGVPGSNPDPWGPNSNMDRGDFLGTVYVPTNDGDGDDGGGYDPGVFIESLGGYFYPADPDEDFGDFGGGVFIQIGRELVPADPTDDDGGGVDGGVFHGSARTAQ